MGVSKFFRWMSERYPFVLQLVAENRIPQFDNLYLDMNGIIHHCSHPNDGDAHFRITEEQIFLGVFSYLEHLFALVKPQKLFFLAVDGVAPRAKMNQQRARRFKTAKEIQELKQKALRKGEALPETEAFDSNCITPGTPFMARLSEQLKYFINKKVSEDSAWQQVQVIFSGHDKLDQTSLIYVLDSISKVPGEGEHKIMEYIRHSKAQPDYNANVRHCLYGLDADLIMLALLSHDPHFCLLREEVIFGHFKKSSGKGLESQQFYLLHISLVREYLDLEFESLRTGFIHYDLERIIDDFILLCIFVGNDFLPHLPSLHINEGALGMLFDIYKKILPRAGGYLNESGTLNTSRLQLVLDELVEYERENFEHEFMDSSWLEGKKPREIQEAKVASEQGRVILSSQQREIVDKVEKFITKHVHLEEKYDPKLALPATYPAKDRKFLKKLASELDLIVSFDEFNDDDEPLITLRFPEPEIPRANNVEDMLGELQINQRDQQLFNAGRVLNRYKQAPTEAEWNEDDFDKRQAKKVQDALCKWKAQYYFEKMQIDFNNPEELEKLTFSYVEGLQWVLHYYYDGVASWSWFYPYHYSPKISDLRNVDSYEFKFELGQPFKPFEQLMGVLPELSSAHIPSAFKDLMTNSESPIIDLYPQEFETDLNGKKHDWEAIVKIPFIDQDRLLKAMKAHEHKLTREERQRNQFGPSWLFEHDPINTITYPSSLLGFFPDLHNCQTRMSTYDLPTLSGLHLIKGLCEGVLLGKDTIAGFPSLHNIPHTGDLNFHGVKIHQSESRKETIVIKIENLYDGIKTEDLATRLIGHSIYIGYPFLQEAKVVSLTDSLFKYAVDPHTGRYQSTPHSHQYLNSWKRTADHIEYDCSKRCALVIGAVNVLVQVTKIKGLKRMDDGALVKEYEDAESDYALQTVVMNVSSDDPRFLEQNARPLEEEFPLESKVFFLGALKYGAPGQIVEHMNDKLTMRIMFFVTDQQENLAFQSMLKQNVPAAYFPAQAVCRRVGLKALSLSKITSTYMISLSDADNKLNIGLNLKFEGKSQKVIGYTRRNENGWEYSTKAVELIAEYKKNFPEVFSALDYHAQRDLPSAEEIFGSDTPARLSDLKAWIKTKGVRDFERVGLYADALDTQAISQLESLSARFLANRIPDNMKQAIIRNVPRKAILKPAHVPERLKTQTFELGDRVTMVSDSGTVPISAKGTVVGLTDKLVDVVFDAPFIGGTDLSKRCSAYCGASLAPFTILNLTTPQYTQSLHAEPSPLSSTNPSNGMGLRFSQGRAVQPALKAPHSTTHQPGFNSPRGGRGTTQPRILQPPGRLNHQAGVAMRGKHQSVGNQPHNSDPSAQSNKDQLELALQPDHVKSSRSPRGSGRGWGGISHPTSPHPTTVPHTSPPNQQMSYGPPRGRGAPRAHLTNSRGHHYSHHHAPRNVSESSNAKPMIHVFQNPSNLQINQPSSTPNGPPNHHHPFRGNRGFKGGRGRGIIRNN